jgi:uncharacterized membrane protein
MMLVTLYSRQDCHLCEEAKTDLEALQSVVPHKLLVMDIDRDRKLQSEFGLEVPVVVAGPFRLKAPFTRQDLQVMLAAAHDRERHIDLVEKSPRLAELRQSTTWTRADSFNLWLSRHYMALFNLLVFIYLGFAFLAPTLMKAGYERPATLLYKAYGLVCHQLGYRSFFLFGEQAYYPRQAADLSGVMTFGEATGLEESNTAAAIFAARNYLGSEEMGYKIALCQRDIAIYGGILLFGLIFSMTGFRLKPLPWYLWLALAIVPIGLDGFSQLLSQPPLSFLPYRESTPFLRVLTGFLFGFLTAWFGYPLVEETMVDTRKLMTTKRQRLNQSTNRTT